MNNRESVGCVGYPVEAVRVDGVVRRLHKRIGTVRRGGRRKEAVFDVGWETLRAFATRSSN